jgi:hypothetical protein
MNCAAASWAVLLPQCCWLCPRPHKQTTGHHPWLQVIPCTKRFVHHWPVRGRSSASRVALAANPCSTTDGVDGPPLMLL